MKTKLQIIQQLLDDRKITAEEAMILMQTEKEYVYVPKDWYVPINPYPTVPVWPYYTTSGSEIILTTN